MFKMICLTSFLAFSSLSAHADEIHRVHVHGHRGAPAVYPEHSLEGFQYAIETGVDFLEMDLRTTRDNRFVLYHDSSINPNLCLTNNNEIIEDRYPIHALTLEEVKSFYCGALPNPAFPDQIQLKEAKILELSEFLDWLNSWDDPRANSVGLHFELKVNIATMSSKRYARRLIQIFRRHHVLHRVAMQSFLFPYQMAARREAKKFSEFIFRKILSPKWTWLNRDLVKALHFIGFTVVPWTANTEEQWESLLDMSVDGIITDDPAKLIQYLRDRNLRKGDL